MGVGVVIPKGDMVGRGVYFRGQGSAVLGSETRLTAVRYLNVQVLRDFEMGRSGSMFCP